MSHLTPDLLNLYLDDQLELSARAAADAHLNGCAQCRSELAALRAISVALDALQPEPLPIDLTPQVLARIAPARRHWRDAVAGALLGAQVVLAALLAGWLAPTVSGWRRDDLSAWPGPSALDRGSALLTWLNARTGEFQAALVGLARTGSAPFVGITPAQWILVVVAVGVVWLVGNRLLLAVPDAPRRRQEEGAG